MQLVQECVALTFEISDAALDLGNYYAAASNISGKITVDFILFTVAIVVASVVAAVVVAMVTLWPIVGCCRGRTWSWPWSTVAAIVASRRTVAGSWP